MLKLLCWCQFIQPRDLRGIASDAERKNLMGLGLIRRHEKSGALLLTSKGQLLLEQLLDGAVPQTTRAYHPPLIQRRVRVSRMAVTAYHGGADIFTLAPEGLKGPASMFLPAITRGKGSNPWGSTRVAGIARLGDSLYAMHYVCPGIGKLALMDELAAFSNQTARFRDTGLARVFVLTADAIQEATGRNPVPYSPPHTQFMTAKGDVADVPLIPAHRKT